MNALVEYDLLEENLRLDPAGNHYRTSKTNFEWIRFAIDRDRFTADVDLKRDLVDRFGAFWENLETGSRSSREPSDRSTRNEFDDETY